MEDVWTYRDSSSLGSNLVDTKTDLSGFKVEALDGSIGSIDEATYGTTRSYIVVDTGPWIFGRKVMLPAGTIDRVDWNEEKVYVDRTKDQIKDSPELDETTTWEDPAYRDRLGSYYGGLYR